MIQNTATALHYVWGQACDGWRLLDRQDLSVIQERMPPGTAEVRHLHARARQLFFVLSGALHVEYDGQMHTLAAGDALEIAPTLSHRVVNTSPHEAWFLVISAPTTRDDRRNLEDID